MPEKQERYVDKLIEILLNGDKGEFYARKFLVLIKHNVFDKGNINVTIHLDELKAIRKIQRNENENIQE